MDRKKIIEELKTISDIIYKGDTYTGIANMQFVIQDIAVIAGEINEDDRNHLLENILKPALEAMEEKDGIMLADILSYELIPFLEEGE